LLADIRRYLGDGYRALKIKIKPGWDIEPVRAVRAEFGGLPLHVDANAAYTLDDLPVFQELDKHGLAMIEQPLHYDDIVDHAKLQAAIDTPVCLDESAHSLAHVRQAIELESCRIINIKIQRVGGLANAQAMHDLCYDHGIPCWVGCMPESGIGHAQGLALAALPNCVYPTDIEATARFYLEDITRPPVTVAGDGTIAVPTGPGLGVEVDEEAIARLQVTRVSFPPRPAESE
jgi:O-succinylbenzoate synthase